MNWNMVLLAIKKEFPYIYTYLDDYILLNSTVCEILKNKLDKLPMNNEVKLSVLEIFLLALDTFKTINQDYYNIFQKALKSNLFIVDTENRTKGSFLNADGSFINFKYTGTYFDVCTIVHEFIHYLNRESGINKSPFNRQCFGEALAIYFELYTQKNLENKKIDSSLLGLNVRALFELQMTEYYKDVLPNLKNNTWRSSREILSENEILEARKIGGHLQHLFGYVLANYLFSKRTLQDVICFNNKINDFTSIEEAFAFLQIDFPILEDFVTNEEILKNNVFWC